MKIAVVGTGYVGLVTGACFAETGNSVTCVDIDAVKVSQLRAGIISIYEPGLEDMVRQTVSTGLLQFTDDLAHAMQDADLVFIAVGTPSAADGSVDLSAVEAVARAIGKHMQHYVLVVGKSTVPVGTGERVIKWINEELAQRNVGIEFDVASNPEFLKEGSAITDFMRPDRIIIGCETDRAQHKLAQLYHPFSMNHDKVLVMGLREAEMAKYAANAMLATKISFINEIATLCDRMGVDIEQVRKGIGSDARIGYSFIYPGCGFGGSCFPKDVRALIDMAQARGIEPLLLNAVMARNEQQKRTLFEKIYTHFNGNITGLNFALWGLSFKPNTDDMRDASSLVLIRQLLDAGATVCAYDPVAVENTRKMVEPRWLAEQRLSFAPDKYAALQNSDALVLVTEWKRFQQPDFSAIKAVLKQAVIFDGRNQYEPKEMKSAGFVYYGIGRGIGRG